MYRFVATPKWIGFALLMITLSGVMVWLGLWQLDRYHTRHAINTRIDQANATAPVPLSSVLKVGRRLASNHEWTRVTATGQYDPAHVLIARDRTVNDNVGFEILAPLVLPDGSRLLVDRGWIPAGTGGASRVPQMPPLPTGPVSVTGRVHLPESGADRPVSLDGLESVRRINPARLGPGYGYPEYLLVDKQVPAATGFTRIPADRQPSWMNAGYTVQWFAFSLLTLAGLVWAIRREAHDRKIGIDRAAQRRERAASREARERSRDRLGEDPAMLSSGQPPAPEPRHGE